MIYQNTPEFAAQLDEQDPLKEFQSKFLFVPKHNGKDAIYLCGNSLGLQPIKGATIHQPSSSTTWKDLAIEGFFKGSEPWLGFS